MSIKGMKPSKTPPIELNFDDDPIGRIEERKLKCANCNNPLECGWLACPKCGMQFEASVPQLSPSKSAANSWSIGKQPDSHFDSQTHSVDPVGEAINRQRFSGQKSRTKGKRMSAQKVATKDDGNSSSGSSNRLARVLVSVALLFIGIPGVIIGATLTFSNPAANSVSDQDTYNKIAGITNDPFEHDLNQESAIRHDNVGHKVGGVLLIVSSALCIPGMILLIGNGKPNPPRPSANS